MTAQKWIELSESSTERPESTGTSALSADPESPLLLRFRIQPGAQALEALLHARRSMLREERTLGRADGEPSLEDAVFSPETILWQAVPGQEAACIRTIAELEARVERILSELTR
ncbi:MAG: hypothetical protein ABJC61_14710 [Acidobacteriota bacterium]